jgi:CRP-like cAMP-binding protein
LKVHLLLPGIRRGEAVTVLDENFSPNLLLRSMDVDDLALLSGHFTRVRLQHRHNLATADQPIEYVYFIESGIASIVSNMPNTGPTEIGIFGREGMSGTAVLLGTDRSPHQTYMQVDGNTALRIDADRIRKAVTQSPTLQALLLRFVQVQLVQTAHSSVANAHHRVEARLARWLLMCHDRIDGDDIPITHEFMSMMIAAQRTGVTQTLHVLEGEGMIRSTRGLVTITDRQKLQNLAGEAYGKPEAEYTRLIAPFGPKNNVFEIDWSASRRG